GQPSVVDPTTGERLPQVDTGTAKCDLTLFMTDTPAGLAGAVEYSADLFTPETVGRMFAHFQTLLEGTVRDPDRAISSLPLQTDVEHRRWLAACNGPRAESSPEECVHHLFEAQAERTPDAVAVAFENTQLTYRQLDARATRLARSLRAEGVGPDTLVGLCVPRSPTLLVAMLAVWKAGGAYVPLDPSYPPSRLAFMLRDAGVAFVVADPRLVDGFVGPGVRVIDPLVPPPVAAATSDIPVVAPAH